MKRFFLSLLLFFPLALAAEKPNVILIMADDLGYHDLTCYGHPKIKTPALDALAAGGVKFTDFHSGATVCTPSRMALLTGTYPTKLGWTQGVVGYLMKSKAGLHPKAITIAEYFKAADYATAMVGKWHIGNQDTTNPNAQGFNYFYGLMMSNNQTKKLYRNTEIVENPFENRLLTDKLSSDAIKVIKEHKDEPFFLYLPYTAPHFPVEAHPDWKGKSNFGVYGDVVEEMDFRIGQIVAELKKHNIFENTIIIFCSDNGPNPREKADSLPFRGEKWSALEGGTRVPCIISWPKRFPKGKTYAGLTSAKDLLPTLCEACDVSMEYKNKEEVPPIDGYSLYKSIKGEAKHPREQLVLWGGKSSYPFAIRHGQWKLFFDRRHALKGIGTARRTEEQGSKIEKYMVDLDSKEPLPPMLFNLEKDPGETEDLSSKFPDKVKQLTQAKDDYLKKVATQVQLPISHK